MDANLDWTPQQCTLPTTERPLRVEEFDTLFAQAATGVERTGQGRARVRLRPGPDAASRAAGLAARETDCCSFFTFTLTVASGELTLEVSVPAAHADVLDALTARATGMLPD